MNTTFVSRRRQAALLIVASTLLLAGCGNGSDDTNSSSSDAPSSAPSSASAPSETPTVVVTQESTTDLLGCTAGSDGCRVLPQEAVFSVLSPWNTVANDRKIRSDSAELMDRAAVRFGVDNDGNPIDTRVTEGIYINTRAWTGPVVADGVPTVVRCRQIQCGDGTVDITLNIPEDISPNVLYDGWYSVFDGATQTGYDLWRARREEDGVISYQFMRKWDLEGPGFNQPYVVSARGSGLPLFGGLIRSGEMERCQINHALAISVPGAASGFFIQPASSTDGNGRPNSLPEGARIFLKDTFQLSQPLDTVTSKPLKMSRSQYRYARCLVETLKTYGAIVVDRAAVPTLYFERIEDTVRNPFILGYELSSIHLEDFNVVDFDTKDRFRYPPQDQIIDATQLEADTAVIDGLGTSDGTDSTIDSSADGSNQ